MEKLRIYSDTSVIGGYFDDEFEFYSKLFINSVIKGNFTLIISEVVLEELNNGPNHVIELLQSIPSQYIETVQLDNEILQLSSKYLEEKIVTEKYKEDAIHVAAATVTRADAIVSWNFKHIVSLDKIKRYNFVNYKNGYGQINIITPMELNYENED